MNFLTNQNNRAPIAFTVMALLLAIVGIGRAPVGMEKHRQRLHRSDHLGNTACTKIAMNISNFCRQQFIVEMKVEMKWDRCGFMKPTCSGGKRQPGAAPQSPPKVISQEEEIENGR